MSAGIFSQELNHSTGMQVLNVMTPEEDQKNLTQSHLLETFKRGRHQSTPATLEGTKHASGSNSNKLQSTASNFPVEK